MKQGQQRTIRLMPGEPHELDAEIDRLAGELQKLVYARKTDRMSAARVGFVMSDSQRERVSAGMVAYHAKKRAARA